MPLCLLGLRSGCGFEEGANSELESLCDWTESVMAVDVEGERGCCCSANYCWIRG